MDGSWTDTPELYVESAILSCSGIDTHAENVVITVSPIVRPALMAGLPQPRIPASGYSTLTRITFHESGGRFAVSVPPSTFASLRTSGFTF